MEKCTKQSISYECNYYIYWQSNSKSLRSLGNNMAMLKNERQQLTELFNPTGTLTEAINILQILKRTENELQLKMLNQKLHLLKVIYSF